jgi:FlaA1/EpsC-like NDP-sugar epimerase
MRRAVLLLLWLATDYALFIASYALAYFVRVGWILSTDLPFARFLTAVALSGVPWLFVLVTTRTFGLTRNQNTIRNASYIAFAAIVGASLVSSGYFFLYQHVFSRTLVVLALALSAVVVWIWHVLFGAVVRSALRAGSPAYPTLVVGVTRESRKLLELLRERKNPLKPVAVLDASGVKDKEIEGVPVMGKLDKLEDVLEKQGITHLIQCSDLEQSINLLSACRARGITYMLLPSVVGIVEKDERIESLEGKAVTVVSPARDAISWFFR